MNIFCQAGKLRWRMAALGMSIVVNAALVGAGVTSVAKADPACRAGGIYILFARGATAGFGSAPALAFKNVVETSLGRLNISQTSWAELGNLDNNGKITAGYEYPASAVGPDYGTSVRIGTDELIKHLNERVARSDACRQEVIVLGGYSEGADVVGWALQRTGYGALSTAARQRIAYVALYGDPKRNTHCGQDCWWIRGNCAGCSGGILGARSPYLPAEFRGRAGSWCDTWDGFCQGIPIEGSHGSIYQGYWMAISAPEIAQAALSKLFNCAVLCPIQEVTASLSDTSVMYTPLQWSYRVKNVSGGAASIQRLEVAVRGPSGNGLDVPCNSGGGVTMQPGQEWTCTASLPTGYGQAGTYRYWADWLDYNGNWHQGQLGSDKFLTLTQAPTLSVAQPISVGPSNYQPQLTPLWWSYRVRNTSGSYASIQRIEVAVRGPAGDALDVPCANGVGVTLAPAQEWTCDAQLPTGYGSTGNFTFWADWLGYDGSWHQGMLGGNQTLQLY